MNYILGGAYKALLFALYLKNLGKEITIVTYNKDIIKYCTAENIDYIPFERLRPTITSLHKLYTLKKMLNGIIEKIDIKRSDKFFLLGNIKAYDSFYLAKELSRKSVGYYKNVDRELKKYKAPKSKPIFFRGAIIKFFLKFVMSLDLIYYEGNNGNPVFGIDDKFLRKYNILEYKPNVSSEDLILDVVKKSKSNYKEYDNLIVDEEPLSMIKFSSIKDLYQNILRLPLDFAFKKHPHSSNLNDQIDLSYYKIFKKCEEIPKYIPVELFCNNIKKNVIAVFSTALTTASRLQHINAISLLELVEWYHKPSKKHFKRQLIKDSKNNIIFPNSFEELKEILLRR